MLFRNLEPPYEPHGLGTVMKWALLDRVLGRRRRSPRACQMPVVAPNLSLIRSATPSITWVGHATWIVRLDGTTIFTDPIWSDKIGPGIARNVAPGVALEAITPDVVVISHNHRDHLDAPTIERIGPKPIYLVPAGLGHFFRKRGCRNVVEMKWWDETQAGSATISFVPSQHWSQRGPMDCNDSLWGGFVMKGKKRSVYFAGDTAYFAGFSEIGRRFPNLDAALLPIGAYDPEWFMRKQHMNPEDALQAFLDLEARRLCAMHWGTFKLTDEPLDEPPKLLEQLRRNRNIPKEAIWVAAIGETWAL